MQHLTYSFRSPDQVLVRGRTSREKRPFQDMNVNTSAASLFDPVLPLDQVLIGIRLQTGHPLFPLRNGLLITAPDEASGVFTGKSQTE